MGGRILPRGQTDEIQRRPLVLLLYPLMGIAVADSQTEVAWAEMAEELRDSPSRVPTI